MSRQYGCGAGAGLLLWFAFVTGAGAEVIHVPTDYATIQEAIDAGQYGDAVQLAPGTYTDDISRSWYGATTQAVAFLKNGVSLLGGPDPAATTIDGEEVRHCLVGADLDSTTRISGITFANGRASGTSPASKWGGGVLLHASAVLLEGNRFTDCYAGPSGSGGGGMLLHRCDAAIIRSNLFLRCRASQLGGGIEVYLSNDVVIETNTFVANDGGDAGGGLLMNGMTGRVDGNIFFANTVRLHDPGHGCIGDANNVTGACNLYWENQVDSAVTRHRCGIEIGQDYNLSADPQFCDVEADDYRIRSTSPASPDDPSGCGLRGALGVWCSPIAIESGSWGGIKSLYRTP